MGHPRSSQSPRLGLPTPILALAGLAALSVALPLVALLLRADWATLPSDIGAPAARSALGLSFLTAIVSTAVCVLIGIPLALYLARSNTWVASVTRVLVNLPLVMPPLVGGLSLLMLFGRRGLIGGPIYNLTGYMLPFTTPAVVVAQVFVAMPFMVITVEGVLRTQDPGYSTAALTLGASPWYTLRRVILPLAGPGIAAGVILTFARALGEFGATALFAGNREGVTQTMPLAIYTAFNGGGVTQSSAIALAIMLLAAAFAVLMLTRLWRPGRGER
mgnify:CR=1 FL=1